MIGVETEKTGEEGRNHLTREFYKQTWEGREGGLENSLQLMPRLH